MTNVDLVDRHGGVMRGHALPVALAALLLLAIPAHACKGRHIYFHDNFNVTDPGWGLYDPATVAVANGWLRLAPTPQHYAFIHYRADLYEQADVCVDAVAAGPSGVPDGDGGLLFADEDNVGFYYFWISPKNRTAGIRQWSDSAGKYLVPVAPKLAQLNTAPGAKNTLRVTVNGGQTSAYVNDGLFVSLAIKPTELGGFFGLGASRVDANPASWTFGNFTITDLP